MPIQPWQARIIQVANLLAGGAITVGTGGGAPMTPTHTAIPVQGNTLVIAGNAARIYLLLVNDSVTPIYINLVGAGAVNAGIRINANGGWYEISPAGGNLYTGIIRANHGAGAVNRLLLVTEGV